MSLFITTCSSALKPFRSDQCSFGLLFASLRALWHQWYLLGLESSSKSPFFLSGTEFTFRLTVIHRSARTPHLKFFDVYHQAS